MNLRFYPSRSFRSGCLALLGAWCLGLPAASPAQAADLPPLSIDSSPRLPGKFVWADLVTDDVRAAQPFYSKLFGWKFRDYGGYLVAFNDDRPMAGMFQRPKPKDRAAEPRWFGYISVPSVDRAAKVVTKAGGRVLAEPKKIAKRGEQAVFADPEGAIFGVVKSSKGDPEDFLPDPGDWVWIELLSRDARKAGEFYREIAGYEIVNNSTSARTNDYVLVSKGFVRAAALTIPPDRTQVKPTWLLMVRVKSLSESVALAKQLGGKVILEPRPDLLEGKLAVVTDPTGAAVGLMEWSHDAAKGAR